MQQKVVIYIYNVTTNKRKSQKKVKKKNKKKNMKRLTIVPLYFTNYTSVVNSNQTYILVYN